MGDFGGERARPYTGQAWTFGGARGKAMFQMTLRDLGDTIVEALQDNASIPEGLDVDVIARVVLSYIEGRQRSSTTPRGVVGRPEGKRHRFSDIQRATLSNTTWQPCPECGETVPLYGTLVAREMGPTTVAGGFAKFHKPECRLK